MQGGLMDEQEERRSGQEEGCRDRLRRGTRAACQPIGMSPSSKPVQVLRKSSSMSDTGSLSPLRRSHSSLPAEEVRTETAAVQSEESKRQGEGTLPSSGDGDCRRRPVVEGAEARGD